MQVTCLRVSKLVLESRNVLLISLSPRNNFINSTLHSVRRAPFSSPLTYFIRLSETVTDWLWFLLNHLGSTHLALSSSTLLKSSYDVLMNFKSPKVSFWLLEDLGLGIPVLISASMGAQLVTPLLSLLANT